MSENTLEVGQSVEIFHDPITCKDSEGVAVLREFQGINSEKPLIESWMVEFDHNGDKVFRRILIKPPAKKSPLVVNMCRVVHRHGTDIYLGIGHDHLIERILEGFEFDGTAPKTADELDDYASKHEDEFFDWGECVLIEDVSTHALKMISRVRELEDAIKKIAEKCLLSGNTDIYRICASVMGKRGNNE